MIPDEIDGEVGGEHGGELDEHAHELLSAYREHHAMSDERRERVWASLGAGVPPGGGSALASASEPWVANHGATITETTRPALVSGLLVAASLCLAVIGWSSLREREREPSPHADASSASEVEVEPPTVAALPGSHEIPAIPPAISEPNTRPPAPVSAASEPERDRVTQPRVRARKPGTTSEPTPSLGRERELIEQVHAALAEGDTATARARLDTHARDYPDGVFVQEREALDAIVRCKAGELERGRELADAFLRAHPHAVLGARVRRTCKLVEIDEGSGGGGP